MTSKGSLPERVYRYIPVHRLWQLLATNHLYFMRNSKWDDPFEGFLVKKYCSVTTKNFFSLNANKFFLCCCNVNERDHLWRNYTPNKDGVLLTIRTKELLRSREKMDCRLIDYPSRGEIAVLLARIKRGRLPKDQLLSLFFIKRYAFEAEHEIRFLLEDSTVEDDILAVPIEPNGIIDRVLFDPRMDHDTYEYHKDFIRDRFGISSIYHSSLYDPERTFSTK
jgi:hypothetical protein